MSKPDKHHPGPGYYPKVGPDGWYRPLPGHNLPPVRRPGGRKTWPWVVGGVVGVIVLISVIAAAAGGGDDADGDGANIVAEAPVGDTQVGEPAEEQAKPGTRDNPLPLGTVVRIGHWDVSVTSAVLNANDIVANENEFNAPPPEGRQFVMFGIRATYIGDESGTALGDLSWAIVGPGGSSFGATDTDGYCGVIPTPVDEFAEQFPGGTAEGNMCHAVPIDQVQGATVRVERFISFEEDDRTFFALR